MGPHAQAPPPVAAPRTRGRRSLRPRRVFTLVERLVATSLLARLSANPLRVLIQVLDIDHYETGKILVNKAIRKCMGRMTKNATSTDCFRIFPFYANISRTLENYANPSDPDQHFTTAIAETSVNDTLSGDCLVLVYRDADDDRKIARLIACFRAPTTPSDPAGNGPVRRLVLDITPFRFCQSPGRCPRSPPRRSNPKSSNSATVSRSANSPEISPRGASS